MNVDGTQIATSGRRVNLARPPYPGFPSLHNPESTHARTCASRFPHKQGLNMETTATKPDGGFVYVSVPGLLAAWWAYKRRSLQYRDFRVWLACHELLAQRRAFSGQREWSFKVSDFGRFVGGVGGEHLRASVRRLERAGLLRWNARRPWVPTCLAEVPMDDTGAFGDFLAGVANHRRKVPIPRRLLKVLVRQSKPVLMATALGHLLRCMYYRCGECRGQGLCKASWVARVFEVSLRNVKAARAELLRLGVMVSCFAPQRVWDEHGAAFLFNFRWDPHPTEAPPPDTLSTTTAPPPERTGISSFGRSENQKPGAPTPSGVRKRTGQTPRLSSVMLEDLKDPSRLAALHDQAASRYLVNQSEADRLRVFAAAAHALRVGRHNVCGLFVSVIRNGLWRNLSARDEDAGRRAMAHLWDGSWSPSV